MSSKHEFASRVPEPDETTRTVEPSEPDFRKELQKLAHGTTPHFTNMRRRLRRIKRSVGMPVEAEDTGQFPVIGPKD